MNGHVAIGDPASALLQTYLNAFGDRPTREDLRRRQRRQQRTARLRKLLA